jgi:chorismate synthase
LNREDRKALWLFRQEVMSMLRFLTAGESHGPELVAVVEGVPAGFEIDVAKINHDLARRQKGYGRGGRMLIEKDEVRPVSGIRFGRTIGSPVTFIIVNRDFKSWEKRIRGIGMRRRQLRGRVPVTRTWRGC